MSTPPPQWLRRHLDQLISAAHDTDAEREGYVPARLGAESLVSTAGTDPGEVPVLRHVGDGRAAVWEYVHDGGGGYVWHLLVGPDSTNGSWVVGFGVDGGSGGAFIVRNKAAGVATKWEQVETISDPQAYGIAWEQKSMAPLVMAEQKPQASAPIEKFVSYRADGGELALVEYYGADSSGGYVRARDGALVWTADIVTHSGGALRAKNNITAAQEDEIHVRNDELRLVSDTGSPGLFWHKRVRHAGQSMYFELSETQAGGPDAAGDWWHTAAEFQQAGSETRIGFYGKPPVAKPTGVPVTVAGIHAALVALGLIEG